MTNAHTELWEDWDDDHPRGVCYVCGEPSAEDGVELRAVSAGPEQGQMQGLELCEEHIR